MLKVQEIANLINKELNLVNTEYTFDIKAEIGERTNENAIYGIVTTAVADVVIGTPKNVKYAYNVELSIPSAKTNYNVINVENIINSFKDKYHTKDYEFESGVGSLTFSLGKPKDYQIKYTVGDDVPLVFTLYVDYTENVLLSTQKHWLLDGMELPFTSESLLVEKDGRTNSINGKSYTETLLTTQTRYYKFKVPFDTSNELCVQLNKDLLNGKYDKVYTLSYYDGVSFTEDKPFTTKVSIFRNGVGSAAKPNASEFDLTFTDVDNNGYQYEMALIDNQFDNKSENAPYFESYGEFSAEVNQQAYFQERIDDDASRGGVGCRFVKIKAPNLSSIDITNQVYEIPLDNSGKAIYDVFDVAKKNYAIIKVTHGKKQDWFYYYVTSVSIGGQNQVMFDLQLDSIQTYYFKEDIKFEDCLIEKAHLNRFKKNDYNWKVAFDGGVDSKLFEREDIQNVAKRLTKRTKVGCNTTVSQLPNLSDEKAKLVADWINDNVVGWIYVYCTPMGTMEKDKAVVKYKMFNIHSDGKDLGLPETQVVSEDYKEISSDYNIPTNISVLCYPILKEKATIRFTATLNNVNYTTYWGERKKNLVDISNEPTILSKFAEINDGYLKFMSVQFSYVSPLQRMYKLTNDNVFIDAEGLRIETSIATATGEQYLGDTIDNIMLPNDTYPYWKGNMIMTDTEVGYGRALAYLFKIDGDKIIGEYEISKDYEFEVREIVNSNKDVKYNPKLLGTDYFELSISDSTENGFVYDAQKLNKKKFNLRISDPLMPGISKTYIRINDLDGVYIKETENNLTGFVNSNESSITMPTSAYQSMIANNKNFFLQNSINRGMDVMRSISGIANNTTTSVISGGATSGIGGAIAGGVASAGLGIINAGMNYVQSKINEELTVDNLRNAPASVVQAKGDVLFESTYSQLGAIVEEYDILPNEKEIVNDYMCKYGFTVNRFGNPKDYDNLRSYYNFVKASVENISGIAMSNEARNNIRQRFANGIRFWNLQYDAEEDASIFKVDYSKENYEKWLTIGYCSVNNTSDAITFSRLANDGSQLSEMGKGNYYMGSMPSDYVIYAETTDATILAPTIETDGESSFEIVGNTITIKIKNAKATRIEFN